MDYIATHIIDARNRLLQQYRNLPNIQAILDALVGPYQTLEDAFNDLNTKRGFAAAEGVQLDRLGDIVGIARSGLTDDVYRTRIKIRVIQNLSQGEPDRLIQVYEFLLGASIVLYQENYPAGLALMANAEIPYGQATLIYEQLQNIAPAGVRVDSIGTYAGLGFLFSGGISNGAGFGDLTNLAIGGAFGYIHVPVGIEFTFAGGSPGNQGYGDLRDPVMGGHLVGN